MAMMMVLVFLMRNKMLITQSALKELFDFDESTGIFVRKKSNNRWHAGKVAGSIDAKGYRVISIDNKAYKAHRLAWLYVYGVWPTNDIDHKDHNTLNNQIKNLRDVTMTGNQQNRIKANKNNGSSLLGAHFHSRTGKYQVKITVDGKSEYLGLFDTSEEAHAVYISAKRQCHGTCTI